MGRGSLKIKSMICSAFCKNALADVTFSRATVLCLSTDRRTTWYRRIKPWRKIKTTEICNTVFVRSFFKVSENKKTWIFVRLLGAYVLEGLNIKLPADNHLERGRTFPDRRFLGWCRWMMWLLPQILQGNKTIETQCTQTTNTAWLQASVGKVGSGHTKPQVVGGAG